LGDCFSRPSELTLSIRVSVNKKSVLNIYCLCSPDEIFTIAPIKSFSNTTGVAAQTIKATFKVNGNQFLAYRVTPAPGVQGENADDLRQNASGILTSNPNQILECTVSDGKTTVDARPYFVSTADNYRAVPVADDVYGLAIVGERHEVSTSDPPNSPVPLNYLVIGYKGITVDNAYDILQQVAPRSVSTLDTTVGTNDELILSTYFPEASSANGMTYFYTTQEGNTTTVQVGNNPHLVSLTASGNPTVSNVTSPPVDFPSISFISDGPFDVNGVIDPTTVAGNYLQTALALGGQYGGILYIALTVEAP